MGSLWDAFGPRMHSGARDPVGCGIQRVVGSVFSKDRVYDEEERHRCILHFPSMREFFTHEEVEYALVQLGWRPLTRRGGWRRYFKIEEPTLPHGLPTIAKLPGRSFVDSPKSILLEFVKAVNRRENRNIFCCWRSFNPQLSSTPTWQILSRPSKLNLCVWNVDYLNFEFTLVSDFYGEVGSHFDRSMNRKVDISRHVAPESRMFEKSSLQNWRYKLRIEVYARAWASYSRIFNRISHDNRVFPKHPRFELHLLNVQTKTHP